MKPAIHRHSGLTLIEMLAVVAIVGILAGLLVPAIIAVRNRARAVMARTEVKSLETAWRKYYSEYGRWPSGMVENAAYAVSDDMWQLLKGDNVDGMNPKGLIFMQFSRFDTSNNPVNPWWLPGALSAPFYYFVQFDVNHDDTIDAGTPGNPSTTGIRRPVITWTVNPKETNDVLWSWQP